jgi:hypothetical protein
VKKMVESFEEFLEKLRIKNIKAIKESSLGIPVNGNSFQNGFIIGLNIFQRELGEWAWGFWKETELMWKRDWPRDYYRSKPVSVKDLKECNYMCEIAIACLGEKEIEKRLKERGIKK